ncbi:hypothetical protein PAT3040_03971, partial [Paenibacillus agaridevorans]
MDIWGFLFVHVLELIDSLKNR